MMKRFLSLILTFTMMIVSLSEIAPFVAFANNADTDAENTDFTVETIPFEESEIEYNFSFPEGMKAVNLTIGSHFYKKAQSASTTDYELKQIFKNLVKMDMNTVVVDLYNKGVNYFELEDDSPLSMIIEKARENNFYIYLNFNLNEAILDQDGETLNERIDSLSRVVHNITSKAYVDGIIIDGYYGDKTSDKFIEYSESFTGMEFENWLYDHNAYVFSLVSRAIHKTNNTTAVGMMISDVWANKSTQSGGSNTSSTFEALTDGYSDTVKYVNEGYADFIIVKAFGSLTNTVTPFEEVVKWWDKIATDAEIPMFVQIANEKICTSERGWVSPDQIIKQLEVCKKYKSYQGCVFNAYNGLLRNPGTSTDKLVAYFKDEINIESIYKDLTMVLPNKTVFTTYEPTVKFQGTFDENFEIYYNGEKIVLNEAGNFYFEEDLDVGVNTFTFESKGKVVTYKITRNVKVLDTIEPLKDMNVEGKSKISVTVFAYRGSVVTASFNGEKITLQEITDGSDDIDENSSYTKFVGSFTAPEGIIEQEQNLGQIVIEGNYKNFNIEKLYGGNITVNALPKPPPGVEDVTYVVVTKDNAPTYDYYTTDNLPDPNSPRLPIGTVDYYLKSVTYYVSDQGKYKEIEYYLTQSGKRIKASDAELVDGKTFISNKVDAVETYVEDGHTFVKLNLEHQVTFNVRYDPCKYYHGVNGDYYVRQYEPTHVLIIFDYVTEFGNLPEFTEDAMFKSAAWEKVLIDGVEKVQLKLELKTAGAFAGLTTSYDGNGNLTIKFKRFQDKVEGSVIVIDPGHGYSRGPNTLDPGGVGYVIERMITIEISKFLTAKLEAMGATVIMYETDKEYYEVWTRGEYARQFNPDLYLSIHCNGFTNGEGIRGVDTFYFNPFSKPIANFITESMATYYEETVYKDGVNRNRGDCWNYFAVTLQQDFPSVLVECGFVTDSVEAMVLSNPEHQEGLAQAIADAVDQYFSMFLD